MKSVFTVFACLASLLVLGILLARVASAKASPSNEAIRGDSTHGGTLARNISPPYAPRSGASPTATPIQCPVAYTYTVSTSIIVGATELVPGSQCFT